MDKGGAGKAGQAGEGGHLGSTHAMRLLLSFGFSVDIPIQSIQLQRFVRQFSLSLSE
jgi:hypothetical protein